jgi:hypothetical protein
MCCTSSTSPRPICCSASARPAEKRNIFEVIKENPELGRRAILMRKFGQEIIEATAGKKIHGTGAIPGGINRNLPIATRDRFLGTDRRDGVGDGRPRSRAATPRQR